MVSMSEYDKQVERFRQQLIREFRQVEDRKKQAWLEATKKVSQYLENLTVKEEPERQPKKWYKGRIRK
jgi:vacuolar-type H+-ATPase subunit D/Vma8